MSSLDGGRTVFCPICRLGDDDDTVFWWHGKTYLFGIRTESFVTKEVFLVVASGSKMILNLLMSTAIAHLRHEGGQEEREGKE